MYFRLEEGNFQPAMLVYLGTKKQLPLPTRRLHLGPLLSTRESIVISSHGCFKFTSDIYNPFLSDQSEQNHTKYIYIYSFIVNALPNEKPTPLWPVVFFFLRCFLPQKTTPGPGRSFVAFYTWRRSRSSIGWPSK